MKAIAVFAFFLFVLAGCATTQQYQHSFAPVKFNQSSDLASSNGNAKIYVLRRYAFAGSGISIDIADTGRPVGKIAAGSVISWERLPGQVVVGASASNEANVTFTVNEGDVVFIETKTNWGAGFNNASCEIRILSNEEGRTMLNSILGK